LNLLYDKLASNRLQVAVQTYQALVKEDSPLATKQDHEVMKHEIQAMSKQLATLIQMFQKAAPTIVQNNSDPTSPSRHTKRPKPNRTPVKTNSLSELFTQDTVETSATSTFDEDVEGCEE
jgi:hypothetical protein